MTDRNDDHIAAVAAPDDGATGRPAPDGTAGETPAADAAHASRLHGADASARPGAARPDSTDAPQYGVGPFSVREVVLLGIWAVAFLVSFFRLNDVLAPAGVLIGGSNVWLSGLWWIPTIALPTVAVGLIVLRRLSPQGIRRVGSLGIDQFASVAFSVAALVWVAWVWDTVAVANEAGFWSRSWVVWVEAVLMVAGVVF
ncbi:MAG: hypothetical protein FJW64_08740, partial [Actinobacteria bacterium]|nr:hypothetical protein [Actinomycetota bacterium]